MNKYLNEPTKSSDMDQKKMKHKIARHRRLNFYKMLALIAVVAIAGVSLYFYWDSVVYTDYEVKQTYSFQKSSDAYIKKLGDSILVYSKDGMSCIDNKGKTLWNQTYEIQNPIVRTCKNVVAIGDYNGRSIYVASNEKILGTINTATPIRDFCVAANGIVAAVQDDGTVTSIYIYDTSGNNPVYFRTTMSKSGYPLGVDISDDGKQVAVSYLKAEAGEISTNVGFYNFSAVGQNYTDNLVSGYGYQDQIIPVISYMNNDSAFALGDHKLIFYQGSQIPINVADIWINDEIKSVFYDRNYVGLIFADATEGAKYRLDIYNTSGTLVGKIPFDMEYKDVLFDTNSIIIYNDNECKIYNWKQYLKYEGIFQEQISFILQANSVDKFTYVTEDKIQNIQLH